MSATPITFSQPSTLSDVEIRMLSTGYHCHCNLLPSSCSIEEGGADSFLESDNEVRCILHSLCMVNNIVAGQYRHGSSG